MNHIIVMKVQLKQHFVFPSFDLRELVLKVNPILFALMVILDIKHFS